MGYKIIKRTCQHCGKKFMATKYQVEHNGGKYCSLKCSTKHSHWKGGRRLDFWGYIHITLPDGSYIREHRYIMSKILDRPLKRNEIVHHKNGNRTDNRPENLELMSQSKHAKLHKPKWILKHGWSQDYSKCIKCGTTKRRHWAKGMCERCYFRVYRAH